MSEPLTPVEETDEYAAAVVNEAPLPALMLHPPNRDAMRLRAAAQAARAYLAAVHDTEMFVARLDTTPDAKDMAEYASLVEREKVTHRHRRHALAAIGLTNGSVQP